MGGLPAACRSESRSAGRLPECSAAPAQAFEQQGKEEEAQRQRRRADRLLADLSRLGAIWEELSHRPSDPDLLHEVGPLYPGNGQEKRAVEWFFRSLAKAPDHRPSHRALAEYFERAGRRDLAARHRARGQ